VTTQGDSFEIYDAWDTNFPSLREQYLFY